MPIKQNINNNLKKPSNAANFNLFIVFVGAIAALILIIFILNSKCAKRRVAEETIDDQIYKLSKKAGVSNFDIREKKSIDLHSNIDEETGLPSVDQEKLGEEYIKDLKKILAILDDQIKLAGDSETIDADAIKIIKKKAMEEIVPGKYQNLHIELILALDKIINGDADGAMSKLDKIKSNI